MAGEQSALTNLFIFVIVVVMLPELQTLFLAITPIIELRGAIPFAQIYLRLSLLEAFFWAVLGNIIIILPLLKIWTLITKILSKIPRLKSALDWIFEKTRSRFYKKYSLFGNLALIWFVAIPLPLTGVWSGTIVAHLFGISYFKALSLISLGVILAGIIVSLVSKGILYFI